MDEQMEVLTDRVACELAALNQQRTALPGTTIRCEPARSAKDARRASIEANRTWLRVDAAEFARHPELAFPIQKMVERYDEEQQRAGGAK